MNKLINLIVVSSFCLASSSSFAARSAGGGVAWVIDDKNHCTIGDPDTTRCALPATPGSPTEDEKKACEAVLKAFLCTTVPNTPGTKLARCESISDVNYPGIKVKKSDCPKRNQVENLTIGGISIAVD
jgi:hypothetical protein